MATHKVFISYHHKDQNYKDILMKWNLQFEIFVDRSVDTGDIDENLPAQTIRKKIRDEYLRDSTVTILLVGEETSQRKHVDWEIHSSMIDGQINKKSGILVIILPTICENNWNCYAPYGSREKDVIYPEISNWVILKTRSEFEVKFPYLPARILDNLVREDVKISVVPWKRIENDALKLKFLIELAYQNRNSCNYDFSTPMRSKNS